MDPILLFAIIALVLIVGFIFTLLFWNNLSKLIISYKKPKPFELEIQFVYDIMKLEPANVVKYALYTYDTYWKIGKLQIKRYDAIRGSLINVFIDTVEIASWVDQSKPYGFARVGDSSFNSSLFEIENLRTVTQLYDSTKYPNDALPFFYD